MILKSIVGLEEPAVEQVLYKPNAQGFFIKL